MRLGDCHPRPGGVGVAPPDCCWRTWRPAPNRQMLWARRTSGAEAVSVGGFPSLSGEASGTLPLPRGRALGRTGAPASSECTGLWDRRTGPGTSRNAASQADRGSA